MNQQGEQAEFAIVGAGLAGTLMAVYLGQAGHRVRVYEKRPDPRAAGAVGGRSINLALSVRGIEALKQVGLADAVLADAVPMRGRMMHSQTGELSFQRYGKDDSQCINSVSRAGLNITLLNAAEQLQSVELFFNARCVDADMDAGTVTLQNQDRAETITAETIIGSDGAYSAVRSKMQHLDRFDYQQMYLSHGYKELCIPAAQGGRFLLEKNCLHIWPRGGYMMIALPNADGSFTCTLFWPLDGPNSFDQLQDADQVRSYFQQHFPDAVPIMPTLTKDYFDNPTSSLVTVLCGPWYYQDRFVLIGDAAHAVVPFYGQGMNASFEDCVVLDACLKEFPRKKQSAFREYTEKRKQHTDTLSELAIANFLEMRDHVASTGFLLKKKGELLLHKLLPGWFLPLYTMVTFTCIPYADAVRRHRKQKRLLCGIAALLSIVVLIVLITVMMR